MEYKDIAKKYLKEDLSVNKFKWTKDETYKGGRDTTITLYSLYGFDNYSNVFNNAVIITLEKNNWRKTTTFELTINHGKYGEDRYSTPLKSIDIKNAKKESEEILKRLIKEKEIVLFS